MDCRLCKKYWYGQLEGASFPIHYCRYYNDVLTEIIIKKDHPTFELKLHPGAADRYGIEAHTASNCDHYEDKAFNLNPVTGEITYRYWPTYIRTIILKSILGLFGLWLLFQLVKYLWH
jgi:hypothetical protein